MRDIEGASLSRGVPGQGPEEGEREIREVGPGRRGSVFRAERREGQRPGGSRGRAYHR